MLRARIPLFLGLLLSLAVAGGCGTSGASDGQPEQRAATEATWPDAAEAICRRVREQVEALSEPETEAEALRFYEDLRRNSHGWIEEIRALDAPAGERARVDDMLDAYGRAMDSQDRLAGAIRRQDAQSVERLMAEVGRWGDRGDVIALELGATECALDPGESAPFEGSEPSDAY